MRQRGGGLTDQPVQRRAVRLVLAHQNDRVSGERLTARSGRVVARTLARSRCQPSSSVPEPMPGPMPNQMQRRLAALASQLRPAGAAAVTAVAETERPLLFFPEQGRADLPSVMNDMARAKLDLAQDRAVRQLRGQQGRRVRGAADAPGGDRDAHAPARRLQPLETRRRPASPSPRWRPTTTSRRW